MSRVSVFSLEVGYLEPPWKVFHKAWQLFWGSEAPFNTTKLFAKEWFIISFTSFWRVENWHPMTTNYLFFLVDWALEKNHQPFFQWKYDFQSCTAGTHQSTEKVSASLTTVSNNESDRKQICLSVQLEYIYWIIDEKSNNVRLLLV